MNYQELTKAIDDSSMSQAPAILAAAVANAVSKGAFNGDGGIVSLVIRTLEKLREPPNDVSYYCYSDDGETYYCQYETREALLAEHPHVRFTGRTVKPNSPEIFWDPEDWLELVSVQDEYSNDHAEGWDTSTKDGREELKWFVQSIMRDWLQRHDLMPKFFTVVDVIDHSAN